MEAKYEENEAKAAAAAATGTELYAEGAADGLVGGVRIVSAGWMAALFQFQSDLTSV